MIDLRVEENVIFVNPLNWFEFYCSRCSITTSLGNSTSGALYLDVRWLQVVTTVGFVLARSSNLK